MDTFYLYLAAVGANWWAFMMAGPFILDEAVKWFWPDGKQWLESNLGIKRRRRIEIGLMIFGVFLAGFLAFKDEHTIRVGVEKELTNRPSAWTLMPDQRVRLLEGLRLDPGENYSLQINSAPSCDPCEEYAEELREFISSIPGWKAGGGPLVFSQPYRRGLKLVTRSNEQTSVLAQKLSTAFESASIHLDHEPEDALQAGMVVIVVGRRPR